MRSCPGASSFATGSSSRGTSSATSTCCVATAASPACPRATSWSRSCLFERAGNVSRHPLQRAAMLLAKNVNPFRGQEKMKRWLLAGAAALATGGVALPAAADTPIPAEAKAVPDPAVRLGTLANGLRYAVMPNRVPTGAVSIRLAFDVGSYLERDDELGYAHFIEHMAFRSTRQAPTGVLDNRFGRLGVAL